MRNDKKIKFLFFVCLIFSFFTGLSFVIYPVLIKQIVDFATVGDINKTILSLILLAVNLILSMLFNNSNYLLQQLYENNITHKFRLGLVNGIFKMHLRNFTPETQARLTSIFNNDIDTITQYYYINLLDIWQYIFTILFSIAALFSMNFFIAVFIMAFSILKIFNTFLFKKPFETKQQANTKSLRLFNMRLSDFMNGLKIIRTYEYGAEFKNDLNVTSKILNNSRLIYKTITIFANIVGSFIDYFTEYLIIGVGVYLIIKGEYTAGALLATLQVVQVLSQPVTNISYLINYRNGVKPLQKEIETLMNFDEEKSKPENLQIKNIPTIKIENISYTVGEYQILKNISIIFEPNKKYLITGQSGCGKSTLLKLINGMDKNYSGTIYFDNKTQKDLGENIYQFIRMAYQDAYLFQKNMVDNITLSNPKNNILDTLINTLQLKSLDEKLKNVDKNEEAISKLSGGEKQRIALARALYSSPKILLLDEVTASLDKETGKLIEDFLLHYQGTVIAVSHQPSPELLENYDKIVKMSDGEIIEVKDAKFKF